MGRHRDEVYALVIGDKRDHRYRRRAGYPGGAVDDQGGLLRVFTRRERPLRAKLTSLFDIRLGSDTHAIG